MMTPRARQIAIPLLLVVGVQLWLLFDPTLRPQQMYVVAIAAVLAAIPQVRRAVFHAIQRIWHVSPRTRARITAAVFVLAAGYLTFTALRQGRPLYPKYHDNQSYAIQAQIIATGRLWLPPHPHADFFDTFHVIGRPVYASMYFPGAAMLFAVGVLLDLQWCVVPLAVSAGCVAMLYRVIAEGVDGLAGLLAAVWLISLTWFRHLSPMLMSHHVLLLTGLAMIWSYLRWRGEKRLRWALLIGAFAGFGAITRPADALCYALPVGVAILLDLRGASPRWLAALLQTTAAIVAAAAPFLALQLVFNHSVSGSLLTSPYRVYLDRDAPQLSFGFHRYDPALNAKSPIVQKRVYHLHYNADLIKRHRPERLRETWFGDTGRIATLLKSTTPSLALMPFVAAGVLGVGAARPRWVLAAVLPLYCAVYLFYAALLQHYTPVVAPATILLGVLGARQVEILVPAARVGLVLFCTAAIIGSCVVALPEVSRMQYDDPFDYPEMAVARETIPSDPRVRRPALVFVNFTSVRDQNIHAEPVYNWGAARIDDNPIIFAHDLGQRNVELLGYYAQRQPDRHVVYYDRLSGSVVPAGTVLEELKRILALPAPSPTTAPTTAPTTPRWNDYNPHPTGAFVAAADTASRIEQFKKMAEADPTNELGHFSLGRAYLDAGQYADAVGSLRRVVELNPNISKAYQLMADAQLKLNEREAAIETLTRGVRIANERGDLMPKNAMIESLKQLGAPVPELAGKDPAAQVVGEGQVLCQRCSRVMPRMANPPFSNAQGKLIQDNICADCWKEWIGMGTKVINEMRLPLSDPQAQKIFDQHMMEFLNLK